MTTAININKLKLTAIEKSLLIKYESVIDKGLRSFVTVGKALCVIRDDRLYRETHKTFEAYVQQRFGLIRQRAYQIIDASEVVASLPANRQSEVGESKAAELKDVPTNKREEVLNKANKAAQAKGKSKATAKDVKEAKGGKKVVKHNFRRDATNRAADALKYDLPTFRKEICERVADYRKHGLPVSTIIVELDHIANTLRTDKVKKAS